jgi:GNAT superfamily N-acetyltransferase
VAVTIRSMTRADLEPSVAAVLAGGWGDRRAWFEFALGHPACDPLVAVDDGVIVGTGAGTRNGVAGWVGTIFVVPERRRAGLGTALTEAACERLEAAGCRTLLLVASDEGRPVYERLGFVEDAWYRILEAPGTGAPGGGSAEQTRVVDGPPPVAAGGALGAAIRRFLPADVPEAAGLDAAATGEDRGHLLAAFATVRGGLALRAADGALRGFVVRAPWGGGATIALTGHDAVALLETRRRMADPSRLVRAGLVESNEAGRQLLHAGGWRDAYRVIRMRRGEAVDWHPERIWGQFNFALG